MTIRMMDFHSIVKNENRIGELLAPHQHTFAYRGEDGEEYRVIHSIFSELNQQRQVDNKHIRWYSVIINLIFRFYQKRLAYSPQGIEFMVSNKIFSTITKNAATGANAIYSPVYIGLLESYVIGICRLGVLKSSREKIDRKFLDYTMGKTNLTLNQLMTTMNKHRGKNSREDQFILTIEYASENLIILIQSCPGKQKNDLMKSAESELFQKVISRQVQRMPDEGKRSLYNINDFWNGLIP